MSYFFFPIVLHCILLLSLSLGRYMSTQVILAHVQVYYQSLCLVMKDNGKNIVSDNFELFYFSMDGTPHSIWNHARMFLLCSPK
jgi:hypothetical protein